MLLKISHITRYDYDHPVDYALQKVRLRPLPNPLQEIEDWDLTVEGGKVEATYADHYGNHVDLVSATPGTRSVILTATGTALTRDAAGILGRNAGRAPLWHFAQTTPATVAGEGVEELSQVIGQHATLLDGLHALSAAILQKVPYEIGKTHPNTSAEEAIAIGHGVCQDHATIFVAAARKAGLPARYVSGYLFIPDRVDQDASHAWAEAHVDGLGWVGFDVSNGVCPDEKYLRLAIGRDAKDAAPISGLRMGSGREGLIVSLQVQQ
ncbi:transglutaminase family protein [Cognatiyoonia sp. IB215182]|uniref:transglutaminase family protein n=1 Tax=Cognatiyoonia sp. IB215182 TaxID=3097353 RepID=UPI002A165EB7|nr:transglutaminase family protein [Cognatiyoonia sp. IB215182]MDX8354504.1 transglutaminase family protein [Cognatiyoonia sp. IB215182]